MSKRERSWTHKKYGKRIYKGAYHKHDGERIFILTGMQKSGKIHNLAFESWQAAEHLGWKAS